MPSDLFTLARESAQGCTCSRVSMKRDKSCPVHDTRCRCTLNLETGFMETNGCKFHAKPERSEDFMPSCLTMLAAEPKRLTRGEK